MISHLQQAVTGSVMMEERSSLTVGYLKNDPYCLCDSCSNGAEGLF